MSKVLSPENQFVCFFQGWYRYRLSDKYKIYIYYYNQLFFKFILSAIRQKQTTKILIMIMEKVEYRIWQSAGPIIDLSLIITKQTSFWMLLLRWRLQ